jgi:molecular chaperone GrpE
MAEEQPKDTTELDELKKTLEQEKEAKLMALADLDNFRKRVAIERQELITTANLSVLNALADVIDDFQRMVDDLDQKEKEDVVDAFKPVLGKTIGILKDYGVEEVSVKEGDDFNHEFMEAIGTIPVEEDTKINKVINIAQKGYKMTNNGRVVRPARVIVGKNNI